MESMSSPRQDPGAPAGPGEAASGVPGDFPLPLLVVMRLAGAFRTVFAEELAREAWITEADAAPPMYAVLRAAAYLDGPSQRDIAASIGVDPSDLVGVLDRMQAKGWVLRERDPADRRRHVVRVTDEGRTFLDRYNAVARRTGDRMMAGLDEAQREAFTATAMHMLREAGVDVTRIAQAIKRR